MLQQFVSLSASFPSCLFVICHDESMDMRKSLEDWDDRGLVHRGSLNMSRLLKTLSNGSATEQKVSCNPSHGTRQLAPNQLILLWVLLLDAVQLTRL